MLRSLISQIMIAALLIMSMEGAADIASVSADLLPGEYTHSTDDSGPDHGPVGGDTNNADTSHCQDCCHGHISCPVAPVTAVVHNGASAPTLAAQQKFQYLAQAPPTPPPTA